MSNFVNFLLPFVTVSNKHLLAFFVYRLVNSTPHEVQNSYDTLVCFREDEIGEKKKEKEEEGKTKILS